jgi:hypothetical protein
MRGKYRGGALPARAMVWRADWGGPGDQTRLRPRENRAARSGRIHTFRDNLEQIERTMGCPIENVDDQRAKLGACQCARRGEERFID